LGNSTTLCTWIRLASGEWRIQLQQTTATTTKNSRASTSTTGNAAWLQAISLPVGHTCARLLMSVVQFLVQLEEQPHQMPLSLEALLHLRQSLEQALWTTVEYLSTNDDDDSNSKSFSTTAIRLLGTLLMEVDIWDLMEKEQHDSTPQAILECLETILPTIEQDYSLLPGLVNILGDAESDSEKQGQLVKHLSEPLVEYLEEFWKRDIGLAERLDDTIPWACTCTELWASLEDDDFSSKRRLAIALIEWIQGVVVDPNDLIQQQIALSRLQSYLSSVLGCYMTLSKDREQPPREHESRVIRRALQLCDMS
jgi:hypothetical protein